MADFPTALEQADKRIAQLESALRQRETYEHELVRKHREALDSLRQQLEVNSRIAKSTAETAETACTRLESYTPIVKAARDAVAAFKNKDEALGANAFDRMIALVDALPAEPS